MKRSVMCLVMLTLALPGAPAAAFAQQGAAQTLEARVDTIVADAMAAHKFPSAMVGIMVNGEVVIRKGYGMKHLPAGVAPDENTVYAIGSLSKAVTAFGVMLLVDRGLVTLADPIGRHLPWLPTAWRGITVGEFMTHTSGMPDLPKIYDPAQPQADYFQRAVFQAATSCSRSGPPALPGCLQFEPGSAQLYTNGNFAVMGKLIEQVSGQAYDDFMRVDVFAPLGMDSTGSYFGRLQGNFAGGYQAVGSCPDCHLEEIQYTVDRYGVPSGGLATTLADLLKWNRAIYEQKLLSPGAYREMFTHTTLDPSGKPSVFTPGWQTSVRPDGHRVIAKNGESDGYNSVFSMVVDGELRPQGIAVIMMTNISGQSEELWPEAKLLLDAAIEAAGK